MKLLSSLVLLAQSTAKDYNRAEHKLRSIYKFYSASLHMNHVLATANTAEIGRGFGKNAGEKTGKVEISKEETLAVSLACMAIY